MASVLIVYGSTTGNTEFVAKVAEDALVEAGNTVTRVSAVEAKAGGLCDGYDLVLFGCSSWGQSTIVLQEDFEELFEDFDDINADGKNTAVFGCGDEGYPFFCGAVDAISEKLSELGATVLDILKIDGSPESEKAEIESWIKGVVEKAA